MELENIVNIKFVYNNTKNWEKLKLSQSELCGPIYDFSTIFWRYPENLVGNTLFWLSKIINFHRNWTVWAITALILDSEVSFPMGQESGPLDV